MRTDLFDFPLPPERIALRPARPRDAARLLVVRPGAALDDRTVRDLPELLQPGDQLVVNDTRVIPASLHGRRIGRGPETRIEATLIKRLDGSRWQAFAKPGKRLSVGDIVRFGDEGKVCFLGQLDASVEAKGESGEVTLSFAFHGPMLDQAIAERGEMPLPPYIASRRAADDDDRADYQTLFAHDEGSVAAPTAGLHFTDGLVAALKTRGIGLHTVTLHVGAGTFLPVKSDDTDGHRMHAEYGVVAAETADADGTIKPFAGETAIFITPGYRFRAVDLMLTNFHLPRSTLFMLVAAFSGLDTMQAAYAHAIAHDYRFYSYGDACLLFPGQV
jgi:S-adenosylmethionine:tRNA ribosyltransferase-isomerase